METNEKEKDFVDDVSVSESIVSNFISTLLNEMSDIDRSDPSLKSIRSEIQRDLGSIADTNPTENVQIVDQQQDHSIISNAVNQSMKAVPELEARPSVIGTLINNIGSQDLDASSSSESDDQSDSLSTALLIDPVCTASEIVNTPHSPIRIIPHPAEPLSPVISTYHTTHHSTEEYKPPQLRLDVLMAENEELLAEVTGTDSTEHHSHHSRSKTRRRSTFSSNAKSNRGDYNYYKHYFNRLSTADTPYIQHHPSTYGSPLKQRGNHSHNEHPQIQSNSPISTNPIKLHRQWSSTLRSHDSSFNFNTDRRHDDSGEEQGVWTRLHTDAQHLKLKKEQLRRQYLQNEIEREEESLRESQRYRLHSLQHSQQNQHRFEYDDDSVFNKLYDDYFQRQRRLQHQKQQVESQWTQQHSLHLHDHSHDPHCVYRTEMDCGTVENRLLEWKERNRKRLQMKARQFYESQCSFQPITRSQSTKSQRKQNQSTSRELFHRLHDEGKEIKLKRKRLARKTVKDEALTFYPNIKMSQNKVPAPSNMERLLKWKF